MITTMRARRHLRRKKEVQLDATVVLIDIDGTLNEAQQPVPFCMQQKLQQLSRHKEVYFVTGNTYVRSVDILNGPIAMYSGIFCCNGDELRSMRGKLIWQDEVTAPLPPIQHLLSEFSENNSVEWRSPRFVNVSKIGRYATKEIRDKHDVSWRNYFSMYSCLAWDMGLDMSIGGAVSVDIYSKGADKSRAAKYINDQGKNFIFIGDKTDISGNDYPVKKYCESNPKNICWTSKGIINTIELINKILGD